VNNSKPKILK